MDDNTEKINIDLGFSSKTDGDKTLSDTTGHVPIIGGISKPEPIIGAISKPEKTETASAEAPAVMAPPKAEDKPAAGSAINEPAAHETHGIKESVTTPTVAPPPIAATKQTDEPKTPSTEHPAPAPEPKKDKTALKSLKPVITIPGYTIITKLGESESFTVWKAKQESLNRFVTIKFLKADCSKDNDDSILKEAKVAARIKSSNVIRVYDTGMYEGKYYFVMEFVDGDTLKYLLDSQISLPQEKALVIAAAIAEGLHEAWSKHGIFHHNLNPANIRIEKDGSVKLSNLGLVGIIQAKGSKHIHAQRDPNYMSPEQAAGGEVDYRTDMYSLGAVLYHIVTGQVPFDGKNYDDVLLAQRNDKIPNPIDINPAISKGCAQIITRLMMKEPRHRFRDWGTVYDDLIKLSEGKIVVTRFAPGAESTVAKPAAGSKAGKAGPGARKVVAGRGRNIAASGSPLRDGAKPALKTTPVDKERVKELKNKYIKRKTPLLLWLPLELAMFAWFCWLGYQLLWLPLHPNTPGNSPAQTHRNSNVETPALTRSSTYTEPSVENPSVITPKQYDRTPSRTEHHPSPDSSPRESGTEPNPVPDTKTVSQEPKPASAMPVYKLKREIVKMLFIEDVNAARKLLKKEYPDPSLPEIAKLYELLDSNNLKEKAVANEFEKAIGKKKSVVYKGARRRVEIVKVDGTKVSVNVYSGTGSSSVKRPATFDVSDLDPLEQSRWLGDIETAKPNIAITKFLLHMTAGDYLTAKKIASKCGPLAHACTAEVEEKIKMLIR